MTGLRIVAGLLCFYHLGIGAVSLFSADLTADFAQWFYGTDIRVDAQFVYSLKALGMYALFTAFVLGLIVKRPVHYRVLVYAVVLLQSMRALSRLVFYDVLAEGFGVSWEHNLFNVGLLVVEVGLLLFFVRRAR